MCLTADNKNGSTTAVTRSFAAASNRFEVEQRSPAGVNPDASLSLCVHGSGAAVRRACDAHADSPDSAGRLASSTTGAPAARTRAQVSWDWYRIHVLFTNTDPISLAIVVAVIPEFPEAAVGA